MSGFAGWTVSDIIAFIALFISIYSLWIARVDSKRPVRVMVDSYKKISSGSFEYIFVKVMYINSSSLDKGVEEYLLEIDFASESGELIKYEIRPCTELPEPFDASMNSLCSCKVVPSNGSISGGLMFKIPVIEDRGAYISSYCLHARLIDGESVDFKFYVVLGQGVE